MFATLKFGFWLWACVALVIAIALALAFRRCDLYLFSPGPGILGKNSTSGQKNINENSSAIGGCDPRLFSSLPLDHVALDFKHVPRDWVLSTGEQFDAYLSSSALPHPVIIRQHTKCEDTYLLRPVFAKDRNNDLDELLLPQKAAPATGSYPQIR